MRTNYNRIYLNDLVPPRRTTCTTMTKSYEVTEPVSPTGVMNRCQEPVLRTGAKNRCYELVPETGVLNWSQEPVLGTDVIGLLYLFLSRCHRFVGRNQLKLNALKGSPCLQSTAFSQFCFLLIVSVPLLLTVSTFS